MKFKVGDVLYYCDPFVFTIEKIKIAFLHDEYYCDKTYAMFKEKELFFTLKETKTYAHFLLTDFVHKKTKEIMNTTERNFK